MDDSQSITPGYKCAHGGPLHAGGRVLRSLSLVDTRRRSDRGCFSLVCWSVSYAAPQLESS